MPTLAAREASSQAHAAYAEVGTLYRRVVTGGDEHYERWASQIAHQSFLPGARNLGSYLAFRQRNLCDLQDQLRPLGLSSLGRCEAHVIPSLRAVLATLGEICGTADAADERPRLQEFALGDQCLQHATQALFGAGATARPHIMVTLPSEAATNYDFVRRLIEAGMDSARINCAHDDSDAWSAMAQNVRVASRQTKRPCRVYMDIAGPKIRVGRVLDRKPHHRFVIGDTVKMTCTEPIVYEQLRVGAPVWIDDGKLGAVVLESASDGMLLRITQAAPNGSKIRPGKGLNFPQTPLPLPALGAKDLADLDQIVGHADIVGQSFVRNATDVQTLLNELERRAVQLPIVAKIETAEAIRNLPEIIVAGAGKVPFGIMIARGDLAIEIGYERLAEMQEEILWICEAAHVPVIWATQVLDQFVRTGIPTRAEISDAAMAEGAECVMLNKGPFIVEAVEVLGDVLVRMQGHQTKKSSRLRALRSWNPNEMTGTLSLPDVPH